MKIALAAGLYPPEIGGPATYALMLEAELPKRGVEVHVIPFGWVRRYPKIIRHIAYGWKVWKESKDCDSIYTLDPISVGLPAMCVAKLRKKPFLVRLGGDYAWEQGRVRFGMNASLDEYVSDMSKAPLRVRILARLQTLVVSRAQKVVVPSQYMKRIVEAWGIASEHVAVIYSALHPLEVSGTREELRHQLSYAYPTIVSAGRLVPWKGFRMLIDVVAELRQRYPDIMLIIVGDGEEMKRLQGRVSEAKLNNHVRFTGSISKDALGATIKAADVFVLNTGYEGLSHQLIEVMDIGVPIVTTDVGGNPELITDGVNGFLVEFNNQAELAEAIVRVINHPESRERIVQSARARSKDFQKEVVIEQLITLLKQS